MLYFGGSELSLNHRFPAVFRRNLCISHQGYLLFYYFIIFLINPYEVSTSRFLLSRMPTWTLHRFRSCYDMKVALFLQIITPYSVSFKKYDTSLTKRQKCPSRLISLSVFNLGFATLDHLECRAAPKTVTCILLQFFHIQLHTLT